MEFKKHLNGSGLLKVSGGHLLYWEDWGNPKAKVPIFYLHGGPGAGFKDKDKLFFNPARQRVIFFDQRGSGRSKPFASTKDNATGNLVIDIDRLRKHLKIGVVDLAGGSWGSTLALCYAIANPEVVQKMFLWGIFLSRQIDLDYYFHGEGAKIYFPEVWHRFINMVPVIEQSDAINYYAKQFEHLDSTVRQRYVNEWVLYENSLMNLDDQIAKKILDLEDYDESILALAKLEAHFFINQCFIDENYILKNVKLIKHIPIQVVHGRYDFACMPNSAFELKEAIGDSCSLHVVPGGHSRSDPTTREVIKAYLSSL